MSGWRPRPRRKQGDEDRAKSQELRAHLDSPHVEAVMGTRGQELPVGAECEGGDGVHVLA